MARASHKKLYGHLPGWREPEHRPRCVWCGRPFKLFLRYGDTVWIPNPDPDLAARGMGHSTQQVVDVEYLGFAGLFCRNSCGFKFAVAAYNAGFRCKENKT